MSTECFRAKLPRVFLFPLFALSLGLIACQPQHIVYVHNNNGQEDIYVVNENLGGTGPLMPVAVATSPDPEIPCGATNDGRIVFTRKGGAGSDIYVVNADGTNLVPFITSAQEETCEHVTKDNLIIYSVRRPAGYGNDLLALSANGPSWGNGGVEQVVANGTYDDRFVAVAPDGRILFSRQEPEIAGNYALFSVRLGENPIRIAGAIYAAPRLGVPFFRAVTNNNRVIYSAMIEHLQNVAVTELFSVATDGSGGVALTTTATPQLSNVYCAVAADGRVLYTERSSGVVNGIYEERGDIFTVGDDGNNRVMVSTVFPTQDDTCNGITSDNRIVFTRKAKESYSSSRAELYSIVADGASQDVLLASTRGTNYSFASITPLNRVLFHVYNQASGFDLLSIQADGLNLVTLAGSALSENYSGVTKNGQVIYQTSSGTFDSVDLYLIPDSGGLSRALATAPGMETFSFVY